MTDLLVDQIEAESFASVIKPIQYLKRRVYSVALVQRKVNYDQLLSGQPRANDEPLVKMLASRTVVLSAAPLGA